MNRLAAAATLAAATLALAGCHTTVPALGPWPVGYRATDLEPGLWAAQGWTPACTWTLANGTYTITGSERVVTLPAAPGVTFASRGCGRWQFIHPGQWTPSDGPMP